MFYALLLKDAGCSSNAPRVHQLFGGDDHPAKRAGACHRRRLHEQVGYALSYVDPGAPLGVRLRRFARLAALGPRGGKELFHIRCDRGAAIAYELGFPERTAEAIRFMDEHWDGGGYPTGLKGARIPLESRIIGLAQVLEIFTGEFGVDRALRSGAAAPPKRWFDPELVDAVLPLGRDRHFWRMLFELPLEAVAAAEPTSARVSADQVWSTGLRGPRRSSNAKSPFTYEHSARVAAIARGMGQTAWTARRRAARAVARGPDARHRQAGRVERHPRQARQAPTADEFARVREHPRYTFEILQRTPGFDAVALDASLHHERLDGRGYYRGWAADRPTPRARILAVADVMDATRRSPVSVGARQ